MTPYFSMIGHSEEVFSDDIDLKYDFGNFGLDQAGNVRIHNYEIFFAFSHIYFYLGGI